MRKKKNLWSGVSILIVAVLVITAFIRGNAQAWLLAAAFVIWAVWATYYFLVPYIKEELHKREAKRIRKKCEKQDAAFDRFIIPEVSDPVEQVLLRHANYRISAYPPLLYRPAEKTLPHCSECKYCYSVRQGKRGLWRACRHYKIVRQDKDSGGRHIPGRYAAVSPQWCPKRPETNWRFTKRV